MTVEFPGRYADHLAAEAIERAVHSVTIGYRLTLTGAPPVDVTSWHQNPALEFYTVRVRAGAQTPTGSVPGAAHTHGTDVKDPASGRGRPTDGAK